MNVKILTMSTEIYLYEYIIARNRHFRRIDCDVKVRIQMRPITGMKINFTTFEW